MEKENISFDILSKLVSSLINEIDSLKTIIKEALGMKLDEQDNRLIGIGKACGILRRKKSTVYHMVREGKLPHYKVGKMLEFQPSELLA